MENVSLFYGTYLRRNETQTEVIHPTEDLVEATDYPRNTSGSTEEIVNQNRITSGSTANYDTSTDAGFHNYDPYDYYYGDLYMYLGYSFERHFYLYIWGILVIFTSLVNLVVIIVLLRRKMRNPTNIVLATIAVSDSLTGLVTLPIYFMVFLGYYQVPENPLNEYTYEFSSYGENKTNVTMPILPTLEPSDGFYPEIYEGEYDEYKIGETYVTISEEVDGYILTKDICRGLIISKFFLSNCFYSISIFLTLFLGIHRFIAIAYPYKSQFLFNLKRTLICCGVIFVVSPILHIYKVIIEKAGDDLCQSERKKTNCDENCIYAWFSFVIMHFMPCIVLMVFTVLFIYQLRVGAKTLRRMDSNHSQRFRRAEENRRISFVVTAIAILFLIPEVPNVMFLFFNDLKQNRTIHLVYELVIVLAFHAKFYIYTIFNRRFRKTLYKTFFKPFFSRSPSISPRPSNRTVETRSEINRLETGTMARAEPDESRVGDILHEGKTLSTTPNDGAETYL